MTFLSPLSRSFRLPLRWLRVIPLFAVMAAALALSACEDKHIGRPCDLGVELTPEQMKVITINPQALECPSRLCILPAQDLSTDTKAFCTDECGSDDDCVDGEKRGAATSDKRCKGGFSCRAIIPKLDGVPLSCKRVCACKDFFLTDDKGATPESCR